MSGNLVQQRGRKTAISSFSPRDLVELLGPAEAQYGEQTLTLALEGASGALACGATVTDGSADDIAAAVGTVAVRLTWNDLVGETGYRRQLDANSPTFVVEDVGEELLQNSSDYLTSQSSTATHTHRVFAHVGHAPGHGTTPIAGDIVSNDCTVTLVIPDV